jgi:hypothetical protein
VLGHFDGYSALAVTRTTNATYENPAGTVWTAAPGVARITTDGLLVEPARTNYALQSATHPKAAEATGAVPVGACVAWHDGTGTMTLAAGTATVTGLSCTTVAAGTLCPFTVTLTGTMALTTTAGTTHAQVECAGSFRTSRIVTTTTALARNADAVTATVPAVPAKFSVAGTFKKGNGAPWTSGTPWSLGTAAGANSASLTMGAANLVFTLIDGSIASKTCTVTAPGYAAGSSQALTAKDLAGTMSLTGGCTQAGAGSGQFGTAPTTLYLGQTSAGDQFSGFIKSLTLNKVTK